MKKLLLLIALLFLGKSFAQMGIWSQKVSSPEFTRGEYFGYSLSTSGDFTFIGTNDLSSGSHQTSKAGTAYVMKRDSSGTWHFFQNISSPDKHDYDRFGERVFVDGNRAIVSAFRNKTNANGVSNSEEAGAVYYYEFTDSTWVFKQKIVANDRGRFKQFGVQIAMKGDVMLIGSNGDQAGVPGYNVRNSHAGSAYVFMRDSSGFWNQYQKLTASDKAHRASFGGSVALNDDYLIVGAPGDSWLGNHEYVNMGGAAYIFKKDSLGRWFESQKLRGHNQQKMDSFGWGIGISDSSLIIGANLEEVVGTNGDTIKDAGAAYVYNLDTEGTWNELYRMTACDPSHRASFGYAISMSNNKAIIGAPHSVEFEKYMGGAAYFYYKTNGGYWQQTSKVTEDVPGRDYRFGSVTAISPTTYVISSHRSGSRMYNGPTHKKWGETFLLNEFPKEIKCTSTKLLTFSIPPDLDRIRVPELDTIAEESELLIDSIAPQTIQDTLIQVSENDSLDVISEQELEEVDTIKDSVICTEPRIVASSNSSTGEVVVVILNFQEGLNYQLTLTNIFMGLNLRQELTQKSTSIQLNSSRNGIAWAEVSNACGSMSFPVRVQSNRPVQDPRK